MPRRGRSSLSDQQVFFVTTTVREWRKRFDNHSPLSGLRAIVLQAVANHGATLFGYVLMPDHLHLLVRLEGGGPQLSRFMRDIKSLSSRLLFPGQGSVWMERFDDVAIHSDEQFSIKLNYLHNNPVRRGLVSHPEDYEYSSASNRISGLSDGVICTDVHNLGLSGGVT